MSNKLKLNILKRMLGKKVVVIKDYVKFEYYYGKVTDVVNLDILEVESFDGNIANVSIFDVRSPSPEFP